MVVPKLLEAFPVMRQAQNHHASLLRDGLGGSEGLGIDVVDDLALARNAVGGWGDHAIGVVAQVS